MIRNKKQLETTRENLSKFQKSRSMAKTSYRDDPQFRKILSDAIESQIEAFVSEIEEYENLTSGKVSFEDAYSMRELPKILVKMRIASHVSEETMAKKLNLDLIEFQRVEDSMYENVEQNILINAANFLCLRV